MPIDEPMDEHEMYEWGNPEPLTTLRTVNTTNSTWVPNPNANSNQIIYNGDPSRMFAVDSIVKEGPALSLHTIRFDQYSEAELRDHWMALSAYIDLKFPPKPPKFKTIEEADAWMEEHYG